MDRLSWRRLKVLLRNPPEDSAFVRAMKDDGGKRSRIGRRQLEAAKKRLGKRS